MPLAQKKLTLLPAVALNMSMMVGIGPFLTIPLMYKAVPGSWCLLGWGLGAVLALADGLVWSELASAFPGSGGTYHFFDAVFFESRIGRMLKFLFVWQFLLSGPLELASGAQGMSNHIGRLVPRLTQRLFSIPLRIPGLAPAEFACDGRQVLALVLVCLIVGLAYRGVESAGKLATVLWIGMLGTLLWVVAASFSLFDSRNLQEVATLGTPRRDWGLLVNYAMYCYLGYYQICYLGGETANPSKTIPRAILISLGLVAVSYFVLNLGLLGALPGEQLSQSPHPATDAIALANGQTAAAVATLLIAWTALASVFAGLVGYSRIPYAASESGHFFRFLARTHPREGFPYVSLLLVGAISAVACLAKLEDVIAALMTSRILVQFVGQALTLLYVHANPDLRKRLRFRMWLYPLPTLVALVGWCWLFGASGKGPILFGVATLGVGLLAYFAREHAIGSHHD